jgi:hypothetical protein
MTHASNYTSETGLLAWGVDIVNHGIALGKQGVRRNKDLSMIVALALYYNNKPSEERCTDASRLLSAG